MSYWLGLELVLKLSLVDKAGALVGYRCQSRWRKAVRDIVD